MARLSLTFYEDGFQDSFISIIWPPGTPRLQASLLAENQVASISSDAIMAFTPRGHKIYFAVATPLAYESENMKEKLRAFGERFEEKTEVLRESTVGFFKRRQIQKKAEWIFGSTFRKDVVSSIFHSYISWRAFSWPFIFVVARDDLPNWKDVLETIILRKDTEQIPARLIQSADCIIMTYLDHGLSLASDKISRETIIEIASNIARKHSLELIIADHEPRS